MNLLSRTQVYLRSIATTVDALSDMVCSSKLKNNIDVQYKIIINMIELEQVTADFVDEIELTSTGTQAIVISTLKLENDTLKIETELF